MTQPSAETGRRIAIVGLLLALVVPPAGAVLSSAVLIRARRTGRNDPAALAGIIIGTIGTLVFVAATWYVLQVLGGQVGACAELGPGTHQQGLFTYQCGGT
ncbi:MAG: hypothetical protein BGO97_10605 [Micrococcales bacterium 70-64]|nr:hypothetical protein [Leifsonia sp.]ODU64434.1 MAG: hypothetical protein ABT06_10610 [Leifsonia sp. SCN 70-46]OJX86125.1 MAG: hypothetical protein BGO97_10605 [Micrococcales bacterium 70-64]